MKFLFAVLLLFFSLSGYCQLNREQVLELLKTQNPESVASSLYTEGINFEIDASFLEKLVQHPQVLKILLARVISTREDSGVRPLSASEVATNPDALVIQKIYELTNNLTVANRLETTPEVIERRLGFRDFMVRTLMEPNHKVSLAQIQTSLGSDSFLPEWVKDLVNTSYEAKTKGFSKVSLTAHRSANITLPSSDRGVHGFLGFFMVKGSPEDADFLLEDHLIYSHPTFPMIYDIKTQAFQPAKIEKNSITTLSLTKILKEIGSVELFPGTWGIRFKHTTGEGSLRSDQTSYIQIEPGVDYDLTFKWENNDKGQGRMNFYLVPKTNP